jgi:hypothetical protein
VDARPCGGGGTRSLGRLRLGQLSSGAQKNGAGKNHRNPFMDCRKKTHRSPLKLKLVEVIFKNSVRTAKKTLHFTITKINWLTLFKEIIAVYTENHTRPINTN